MSNYTEQELIRRESLSKIQELGIDPYPAAAFHTTYYSSQINSKEESEFEERTLNHQSAYS